MFWKRALIVTITALTVVGLKFYQKHSFEVRLRKQMVSLCAQDKICTKSVEANLDTCYDKSYAWGGRFRHQSGLDYGKFLHCFNSESGKAYFEVESSEHKQKID